ncbi:C-C motif chemokine 4-like isoform X1 [Macrotis lagotis]|uniref:C-C motif chemokine 4-like isoform X1 n=1 Tax=Macrotis lagotis TaxID=92651 RepID=UPI003D69462E
MEIYTVVFSILLVMVFTTLVSSAEIDSYPPISCCFAYVSQQISRKVIIDYYETSSMCFQPAVVFLTKSGHQICANPNDNWVQNYVNYLELTERFSALDNEPKRKMIQNKKHSVVEQISQD